MCQISFTELDIKEFRKALGMYPTGVAVVTTAPEPQSPVGITINSFSSISLDPALVGWCIDRRARGFQAFSHCSAFTISVLADCQEELARRFATRGADKFAGITTGDPAGPVLPGVSAWLRCRLYRQVPLGDHLMLVGQVEQFGSWGREPLVFARGEFGRMEMDREKDVPQLTRARAARVA